MLNHDTSCAKFRRDTAEPSCRKLHTSHRVISEPATRGRSNPPVNRNRKPACHSALVLALRRTSRLCSGAEGSVLTFTSDELTEAVEWTGALRAKLFVRVGEGSADASFLVREPLLA